MSVLRTMTWKCDKSNGNKHCDRYDDPNQLYAAKVLVYPLKNESFFLKKNRKNNKHIYIRILSSTRTVFDLYNK